MVLQLYGGFTARRLNPAKVITEIEALEHSTKTSHTKPPLQFKYAPLKGLWHKHFLADGLSTFARNLKNGLYKDGLPLFEDRVREAQEAGEERYVTTDDINAIVNDAVHGNWMRRSSAGELTGDWIIYAQHRGENYYLSLGTHDSGDQNLRDQIDALCCKEFPFLTDMRA